MSAATLPTSVLAPQPPGGLGRGAALALAVHAALVAALTVGVDWRTHAPQPVAAELWAAVPEAAAPPAAPPPPAPAPNPAPAPVPAPAPPPAVAAPPPDIATERERERRRAEADAEREAARRAEAQRRADERAEQQRREREARAAEAEAKAAEERLARQREENLRRMLGQANASPGPATSAGTAAQAAAPSAAYQGRVKAAILPNIVYTGKAPSRAVAEVEVTLAPGGTVISRRLVKRSGHPDWDEAVLRAIDRTPRIPADVDGRVPPALLISFRPDE
ncbi:MAG: cell envelope integrity protein TolA [Betaproteobacteria bacterium]